MVSTDGHVSFVFSQLLLKSLQFLSLKNKMQVKKKMRQTSYCREPFSVNSKNLLNSFSACLGLSYKHP